MAPTYGSSLAIERYFMRLSLTTWWQAEAQYDTYHDRPPGAGRVDKQRAHALCDNRQDTDNMCCTVLSLQTRVMPFGAFDGAD